MALFYNTYDQICYLMYLRRCRVPLSYDLTTFLESRAEICQLFRGIFGKSKISKGHSEIIWPLNRNKSNSLLPISISSGKLINSLKRLSFSTVFYLLNSLHFTIRFYIGIQYVNQLFIVHCYLERTIVERATMSS